MSHKVHPIGFRLKDTQGWASRWIAKKDYPKLLEEDVRIRAYLSKKLKEAGIASIEIERQAGKLNIIISTGRPGLVIGRGGSGIEELRRALLKLIGTARKTEIKLDIREIRNPWESASLTGQAIAQQLEKRMPFRRVLKQTLSKIMSTKGIEGARIEIAGRLGGADMSRREWVQDGRLPRQTLRANIDYAQVVATTTYGTIGIKVWIYKGEIFDN
ncbi:MAG: 30S ribosomal protein S3 [Candidatus Yanofskybacteria bacterium]|nr:30S ribosomal protein S3 [Candidatus Yanofskybacteria bacterium]